MHWKRSTLIETLPADALPAFKSFLRVSGDWADSEVHDAGLQAWQYIEGQAGITLFDATWSARLETLAECIKLPQPPLKTVTSIVYDDPDATGVTWANTEYDVLTATTPGEVRLKYLKTLPTDTRNVVITYTAGYGTQYSDLPPMARRCLESLVHHNYWNRDGRPVPEGIHNAVMNLMPGDQHVEY